MLLGKHPRGAETDAAVADDEHGILKTLGGVAELVVGGSGGALGKGRFFLSVGRGRDEYE
jgi:hypothetical protein